MGGTQMQHTITRYIRNLLFFLFLFPGAYAVGIHNPEQDEIANLERMRTQIESRWGIQLDISPEEFGHLNRLFLNFNTDHPQHHEFVIQFVNQLDQWSHPSVRGVRAQALADFSPFANPANIQNSLQSLQLFYDLYADPTLSDQTRANRLEQARKILVPPLPGQHHPHLADILFPPQNED